MFQVPGWNSNDETQEKLAEKLFADVPNRPKKKRKHKEKDSVDARPMKLSKKSKASGGGEKIDSETEPDRKLKLLMEMLEGKRDGQRESKEITPCHQGKKTKKDNVNKRTADLSVFVVGSTHDVKKRKKKKKKKKQEKNLEVKDCLEESKTQEADKGNVCEDDSLSVSGAGGQVNKKKRKREKSLEVENSLEQSVPTDTEKSKVSNNYSLSISKTAGEPVAKKKRKKKRMRKPEGEENNDVKVEVQVVSAAEKGPSTKQKSMKREKKEASGCVATEQHLERTDDSKSHTKQTDHKIIDSKMLFCDAPSERTKLKDKDFKSKLQKKLSGAQFRWINEQLYTTESQNAFDMFSKDPNLFYVYHTGFQNQVESWPQNPVDIMIRYLNERRSDIIVADMGCGEAKIAQNVEQKVHSFDLVSHNEYVTACDMSKVPIDSGSVDVAIFCLSLMGTNIVDFLKEANRILKLRGILKIAEVVSRFDSIKEFIENVSSLGFKFLSKDTSNKMFVLIDFEKISKAKVKSSHALHLKPCIYKRR